MRAQRVPEVPPPRLVFDDLRPTVDAQLNDPLIVEAGKRYARIGRDLPNLGRTQVGDEGQTRRCLVEAAQHDGSDLRRTVLADGRELHQRKGRSLFDRIGQHQPDIMEQCLLHGAFPAGARPTPASGSTSGATFRDPN